MGNLLRRVLAFVLGMVFTIASASASVVGGAYWAYKNIKPVGIASDDPGLGDLRDQTIEDLMFLLNGAMNNPDKYTLARLEAEYGLDLEKLLKNLGIENVDKDSDNWQALTAISLFSLKDGLPALLSQIKVRALYNFLPSLTGKRLKDLLSPEAQEKLGDYTLMELFESDEETGETGIIKALKNIKLGALLPAYFDGEFDEVNHEYNYVLADNEEAQALPVLEVFGNVSLGVISSLISGGDIMAELMEGSLSSISEMPIEDIISSIAKTVSPELGEKISSYAKFLNGARIKDLFYKNDGKWEFYYAKVLGNLKVGYLFGLEENEEGVWVDKDGKPAKDLMQVLAGLDINTLVSGNDTFTMIRDLIGDVNIGMVLDMLGIEEGEIPFMDAIRGIQVGELLKNQGAEFDANVFVKDFIANLADSLGDRTLGELIFKEGEEPTDANAIVKALFNLRLSDFIKEEYTLESVIAALRNALGDVSVGDVLGIKRNSDGTWNTDDKVLALILDFSFDNIFDVLTSDYSAKEVIKKLFPETKVGDLVCAFMGFEVNEENGRYYKENDGEKKYLSNELSELFDCKLADLAAGLLDRGDPFDSYEQLAKPMLGDLIDFVATWLGTDIKELNYVVNENGDGEYEWEGEPVDAETPVGATSRLLSISVAEFVKDIANGGSDLISKDIEEYISIAGALVRFIAKSGGYTGDIDGMTKSVVDLGCYLFDGKLYGFGLNYYAKIPVLADLTKTVAEKFIPAGTVLNTVSQLFDEIGKLYENSVIDTFLADTMALEVDGIVSALGEIVKKATPDNAEKVDHITALIKELIDGQVSGFGIDYTAKVRTLAEQAKAIADDYLPEGTAKNVVDEFFDQVGVLYPETTLDTFLSDMMSLDVDDIAGSLGEIVKKATPDNAEKVAHIVTLVQELIVGQVSGFGLDYSAKISTLAEESKTIADDYLPEGAAKNVVDELFDQIGVLYPETTLDTFVEDTAVIGVDNVITSLGEVVKKGTPDNAEKVAHVTDLINYVLAGELSGFGIDYYAEITGISDRARLIAYDYVSDGKVKDVISAVFDEINTLYPTSTIDSFVVDTNKMRFDTAIESLSRILKVALPDYEEQLDAITKLVVLVVDGRVVRPGWDLRVLMDDVIVATGDVVKSFWKDGAKKIDAIVALATLVVDGKLGYPCLDLRPEMDEVIVTAGTVVKAFWEDGEEQIDAIVNLATMLVDGKLSYPCIDLRNDVDGVIIAVADVIKSFWKDGEKKIDAIVDLATMVVDGRLSFPVWDLRHRIDDVIVVAGDVVKAFWEDGSSKADAVVNLLTVLLDGKAYKPGWDLTVYVTDVTAAVDKVLTEFGLDKSAPEVYKYIDVIFGELDTLYEGVKLKYFVSATVNAEFDIAVDLAARLVHAFYPAGDKYAEPIGEFVKLIIGGKVGRPMVDLTVYVTEVTASLRNILAAFGYKLTDDDYVSTVLAEVDSLYEGKKLKHFVAASANLEFDAVVNSFVNIAVRVMQDVYPDGIKYVKSIEQFVTLLIGGKISRPMFDLTIYVTEVTASVRNLLTTFVFTEYAPETENYEAGGIALLADTTEGTQPDGVYGYIDAVFNEIDSLYAGVKLKHFVAASANLEFDAVVDSVANIATKVLNDVYPDGVKYIEPVTTFVKVLIGGKISAPMLDLTAKVNEVTDSLCALIDTFVPQNDITDIITDILDEIGRQYHGVMLKDFASSTLSADFDKAVVTLADIAKIAWPDGAKYIDAVANFLITMIDGKVCEPKLDLTVTVDEVIDRINELLDVLEVKGTAREITDFAFKEILSFYSGVTLQGIPEKSKSIEFDDVVDSVVRIIVKIAPEQEENVKPIAELVKLLIGGPVISPKLDLTVYVNDVTDRLYNVILIFKLGDDLNGKINVVLSGFGDLYNNVRLKDFVEATKDLYVARVITYVESVTNAFGLKSEILDTIYTELKDLYKDAQIRYFVDETLNLDIDETIMSLATIVKSFKAVGDDKVDAITNLATMLLKGTVGKPEIDKDVIIVELADAFDNFYSLIIEGHVEVLDNVINELITQVKTLYPNSSNTIGTFVDDSLKLDVDVVIESVRKVFAHIEATSKITDRIAKLASAALDGTLGDLKFNLDAFLEEATTTEILIIGGVILVTGTILYFVANETLIKIVDAVLGKDCKLGTLIAEPMGYTVDGETYTFEGKENDLANTLFNLTVQNVLTKGFDFKSVFEDKLYIDDIAMMAKAVESKYAPDEVKSIADVALDVIADLYNETHVKDFVSATVGMETSAAFGGVAKIVNAATKNKYEETVNAIEKLLSDAIGGKFNALELPNRQTTVDELVSDIEGVTNAFGFKNAILTEVYEQLCKLYQGELLIYFVDVTCNLELDAVIGSTGEIVKSTEVLTGETIDTIVDLAQYLVDGIVSKPEFNMDAEIALIAKKLNAITDRFELGAAEDWVDFVLEQVAVLFPTSTIKTVGKDVANIELDAIIDTLGAAVETANLLTEETVDTIVDFAQYLAEGTVSKPGFNMDAEIAEIARKLNAITDRFELGAATAYVECVFEQVTVLFPTTTIRTFVNDAKELELDAVIGSAAEIFKVTELLTGETVDTIVDLAQYLAEGTVSKPGFNMDAEIAEIARKLNAITDRFELGAAEDWVDFVLEQVAVLFPTSTIKTVGKDVANIELDAIIDTLGAAVATAKLLTEETVDTIVDFAQYLAEGTVSKPGFNMDAEIAEIAKKINAITDRFELGAADAYVDSVLEQIAKLFPTSTIKTFVGDAKVLELDAVIGSLGEIFKATELLTGETVDTIIDLAQYLAEGTVSNPGFNMDAEIAEIAKKLNAITDRFELGAADAWIDLILEQVAKLFPTSTIKTVGKDAANIELDAIVDTLGAAIVTAELLTDETVDTITDLAKYLAEGTVSKPGFNMDAEIAEITKKLNAITDRFELGAADAWVDLILEQIAKLFPTSTIKTFAKDAAKIELDAVVDTFGEAIKTAELLTAETVDTITDLAKYLAEGTVSKPGFNMDAEIAEITKKLNAITDRFELGAADAWVDLILEQIAKLFPTSTIKTFAKDAAKIELDAVVDTFGEAIKTAELLTAETVDTITDLAKYLAEGTVSKPGFNMDAEIAEITKKLNAITDRFELGAADAWVDLILEQIAKLFPTSTIKTFVKDAAKIELDAVVDTFGEAIKTAELLTDKTVDTITDLAKYLAEGTVSKPGFNMDAEIAVIAEKVNTVTDRFKLGAAKAWVDLILEQIAKLFPTSTIKTFVKDAAKIELDAVIDTLGEAVKTASLLKDLTVDTIADLAKYLAEGTVSKPGFNMDAEIAVIAEKVNAVTDRFKLGAAKAWVDVVLEQVGVLFPTSTIKTVAKDAANIELDNIITAVANIVKTGKFTKDAIIDAIADLAKELVDGTIKSPKLNSDALVNDVAAKLTAIIDEIEMNANLKKALKAVIDGIGELYDGVKVKDFVAETMNRSLDSIIDYIEKVVVAAFDGDTTEARGRRFAARTTDNKSIIRKVNVICDLLRLLADGTVKAPAIDKEITVDQVVNSLKAVTDEFALKHEILTAVYTEIAALYENAKVVKFVDATLALELDNVITAVANIIKSIKFVGDDKVDAVSALAKVLAAGTIKAPKLDDNAKIIEIADAFDKLYSLIVEGKVELLDNIINEIIAQVNGLYTSETTIKSFVADSKKLDVDETIESVRKVFAHIEAISKVTDRIATLASAALKGTFAELEFEFDELMKVATTTEKIIGGAIVLGVGTVLYFVANETLLSITDKALGPDRTIGSLCAEYLGYTVADDKYTFEDEENELANTLFTLKVHDALTKGYDFKARFEDKLYIDDIALFAKAIESKYAPDDIKSIVNVVLDVIADLYDETHVKDFVSATVEMEITKVFNAVASIVNAATKDAYRDKVDAIAALLCDVIVGKLSAPEVPNKELLITEAVADVENVTDAFDLKYNALTEAYSQLKKLYEGKKVVDFVDATKELAIDDVIGSTGEVTKASKVVKEAIVNDIVDLAQYVLAGKVSKPEFSGKAKIAEIANKVKTFVNEFNLGAAKEWVDCILDQVGVLLPTATIRTFVSEVKEIELDAVIYSAGEIFKVSKLRTAKTVDAYVDFVQYIATGKVVKPQFDGDAQIAEIANKAKAIAARYKLGKAKEWIDCVLDQVGVLLPTATIRTFVSEVKEIELDAVIYSAGEIFKVSKLRTAKTVDIYVDFVQYIVTGKVVKPQFDGDAQIAEIANKAKAIAARYKLGKAKEWIDCVLDEIGALLPTATIRTVKDDVKEIEIDAVIGSAGEIFKVSKLLKDLTVDTITDLAQYIVTGKVVKPQFDGDAQIAEIASKIKAVINRFDFNSPKGIILCTLDQIGVLLPTATIRTVKDDVLNIELDALLEATGNVVKYPVFIKDELVETIVVLAQELADGTIRSPKFNSAAYVETVADEVNAIIDTFEVNNTAVKVVKAIIGGLGDLYTGVQLKDFVTETMNRSLDGIIDYLEEVIVTALGGETSTQSRRLAKAAKNNSSVIAKVNVICDLLRLIADGTVKSPAVDKNVTVDETVEKVQAVTDEFKAKHAVLTAVYEELKALYNDAKLVKIKDATLALELDNIINSVANIVKSTKAIGNEKIDAIAELAKELANGTVKSPKFNGDALVSTVATDVNDIVKSFKPATKVGEITDAALVGLGELYDGVSLKDFAGETLNRKLDGVIAYVEKVTLAITDDKTDTIVTDVAAIMALIADGTLKAPAVDKEVTVDAVVSGVQTLTDDLKVKHDILTAVYEELKALYNGAKLVKIADATLALELDNVIGSLAAIVKSTKVTGEDKINVIADLAILLVAGTIKAPAFDTDAKVVEIANAVDGIYSLFVEGKVQLLDDVINELFAQINALYASETTLKSFVADSKKLDIDDTIESVRKVFEHIDAIKSITDRIAKLASVTFDGTFEKYTSDMNALMNEATTTEKIIGGAIILGAGTLLYFVANPTLLKITDKALGPDRTIGSLIAKHLGYTVNGDKYTFEDEENELANALFTLKVHDALTKGYDFKARFEDKLYVDDIAMIAKAIESKYLPADVKSIADIALDVIAETYDEVHVKDFVSATVGMEMSKVFHAVAMVVNAATKDEYKDKVDAIEKLLGDVIVGKISAPEVPNKELLISETVTDVENITNAFDFKYDALTEAYNQLKSLYEDKKLTETVDATKELEIDAVLGSAGEVIKASKVLKAGTLNAVVDLAQYVLTGKVVKPQFSGKAQIAEIANKTKLIANRFDLGKAKPWVNCILDQVGVLLPTAKIKTVGKEIKEIEIDAVIEVAGNIFKTADLCKDETVNAFVELVQYIVTGKVVKPQFDGDAEIAEIANKAKTAANRFDLGKAKPWVDCVLDQVGVLLPTATIRTFVGEVKEIEIDTVIYSAGEIFKVSKLRTAKTVDTYVDFVQYIVTGKVVKPQFDGDAQIAEIANKAKTIAKRYKLGKAQTWVEFVLDQVGVLFPTSIIRTVGKDVKEIEIDAIIDVAGNALKTAKVYKDGTIDTITDLAKYIVTGKVVKPQFDGDAQIAEIANKANAVVNRFKFGKAKPWINCVIDQVGVLLPTSTIRTVAKDIKEIEFDTVIEVAGNIFKTADLCKDGTVDAFVELAQYVVTGKVVKPKFDGAAEITVIAAKVKVIANRYDLGKAKPWINCVLDEIGTLYEQATLKSFVESSKNIELQKLLASVKAITGVAKGLNDKLAFIYKVLEASLSGTIAKPGFDFAKAFSVLTKTEKTVVIVVGAVVGVTMYYVANPLLVKIASKVFKESETWGDKFAKSLGYTFDETQNRYMRTDDLYNALVDTWLGMKIVESLKTEYKIIDKLSAYITLGNIATANEKLQDNIEKFMKGASFYAEGDKWMICRLSFDHLEDIVLNTSLKEILDNKKSLKTFLFNKIDSLTIADFGVGSFIRVYGKGSKIKGFKATAEYDAATEKWAFGGSFNELFNVLLNCTIGDMRQIKQKYGSFKNYVLGGMENLVVGDVLGYAINMANEMSNNKLKITAAKDEARGWTAAGKYAQVLNRFVNINLKELYDNLKSNMKDYISSEKLVGGIRIGELLDGGYNVYDTTTDKWSNEKGEMTFKSGLYGMLIKKIYTIQLGEFMTGKGYNISKLTEDTYLGDVFKFTCDHNDEIGHKHTELCKWFETKSVKTAAGEASVEMLLEVDAVYGALSSMSLNDLIDGDDVLVNIKKLTLGDMMGYVKELKATGEYTYYEVLKDGGVPVVEVIDGYAYKRAGEEVSKLTGTLAKVKVDTLMSGEGVDEIMNEIEKLQLGDILRYTYDETADKWYDGETEITGILAAFCDHTLAELKDPAKLKDIVNELKLKDVLGEDAVNGNAVLVHLGNTKIGKLSERINNMYIGEVLEYSSTVKKHGEYDIYTDSNSVEYYNDSAMSEGGVFAGYWKKVEDGVEDYTMSKEPDTETGRYKSTDNRYLSLAHTWKKAEADGTEKDVTGVTAVLANFRISELDDPDFNTRLDSAIDNMKLGNFIAIDNDSPVILKELANTKLKDVSEQIELIKVGTLMGYAYNEGDGKWYNGGSALTDSFTIKIANHTIKEVSSGSFSDMLAEDFKTIKVSKVMAKSDCTLFAIMSDSEYNELTIDNMGGKLNDKLANVTLGDAVTIGVLDGTLFNTKGDAMRIAYNAKYNSTYTDWRNIPAKNFVNFVIEKAFGTI